MFDLMIVINSYVRLKLIQVMVSQGGSLVEGEGIVERKRDKSLIAVDHFELTVFVKKPVCVYAKILNAIRDFLQLATLTLH